MQNQFPSIVAERLKEILHNDARTHIGWIAKPVQFTPAIPTKLPSVMVQTKLHS